MWHELIHMYLAGYIVAGFIVAGVYAYAWLQGRRDLYHRTALVVTLAFASLAAPVQVVVGDWAGRTVAEHQPVKLAAFEGLQQTQDGRAVHIGGYYADGEVVGIEIPKLLSLLAVPRPERRPSRGSTRCRPDDRPPVNDRALRVPDDGRRSAPALALLGARVLRSPGCGARRCRARAWFYRAVMAAGPLAFVALIAGWITTEVGRQPWIVYEVMRTAAGGHRRATACGSATRSWSLVYVALGAAVVWLLRRLARRPPKTEVGVTLADVCLGFDRRSASPPTRCSAAPTSAPASGT